MSKVSSHRMKCNTLLDRLGSWHGLLLVDKPKGITSHDVVARVRRIGQIKEVGHAGTLDPLATGLLVLLVGEATKLSSYLLNADKSYFVKGRLGIITDTLDITGTIQKQQSIESTVSQISDAVLSAQGKLILPVPVYSAVKTSGMKLCDKARRGELFQTPQREMTFFNVKVKEINDHWFSAYVDCRKGGYIRSWVQHIGEKLGCGGTVEELRRLKSGHYHVDQSVSWDALNKGDLCSHTWNQCWIPLKQALPQWKALTVKGKDEHLMSHGLISHELNRRLIFEKKQAFRQGMSIPVRIIGASSGQLLSLVEAHPEGGIRVQRVFQLN